MVASLHLEATVVLLLDKIERSVIFRTRHLRCECSFPDCRPYLIDISEQGPPVYTFSVPAECRGYVIGAQGANLVRISEETGVRVTRGKPKEGGDPQERDFLFFNDNNVGTDMVEQALVNVVNIVRRKIPDWLPKEGKAAEDAQRLFREGRFGNSNYNRGSTSNDTTNRYNGPNGYREEDAAITSPSFSTNGIAHSAQGTASPGNDDLPTAVGR